jgi:hypothetical protein
LLTVSLTVAIHEAAHIVVAGLLGIGIDEAPHFSLEKGGVAITFKPTNDLGRLRTVHYSGGLVTGLFWMAILLGVFLYHGRADRNVLWWINGLLVSMLAFWQVGQGLLEGMLHNLYITGAGRAGSAGNTIQILFLLMGMLYYLRQTRIWRRSHKKARTRPPACLS